MVWGRKGEKREWREELLAVMEKEVMAVSLLCRELSPTLLRVSQQEMSGSIREESACKDLGQPQRCVLFPPVCAQAGSPELTCYAATLKRNTLSYYPRHFPSVHFIYSHLPLETPGIC